MINSFLINDSFLQKIFIFQKVILTKIKKQFFLLVNISFENRNRKKFFSKQIFSNEKNKFYQTLEKAVLTSYSAENFIGPSFLQWSGLKVTYNLSNPDYSRVIEVKVRSASKICYLLFSFAKNKKN